MFPRFRTGAVQPPAAVLASPEMRGAEERFVREGLEHAIQDGPDRRARTGRVARSGLLSGVWRLEGSGLLEPHRSLDPDRVARLEAALWVAYYRHEWIRFLRTAVFVMRHVFGLPWLSTVRASWFLRRATQLWAPCPDNDAAAARRAMERFYRLLKQHSGEAFDPAEAARLEVEWWHLHRIHQHSNADSDERALVDALAALYGYAFRVPDTAVRIAAEQRALAMGYCDQWVRSGCDLQSSLIAEKRAALLRSYESLAAAVQRA
jgi:hypothetical protein